MEYPILESLVAHQRVVVIARKNYSPELAAGVLTTRFNDDESSADIWATSFYRTPSKALSESAKVVVGTVPDSVETIPSHHYIKDFSKERGNYLNSFSISRDRIETIETNHWRKLREETPAIPLSGIALLSMLEKTSLSACDIYGMNFYANEIGPLHEGRWFDSVHHLYLSARWLNRLLECDSRFRLIDNDPISLVKETRKRLVEGRRAYKRATQRLAQTPGTIVAEWTDVRLEHSAQQITYGDTPSSLLKRGSTGHLLFTPQTAQDHVTIPFVPLEDAAAGRALELVMESHSPGEGYCAADLQDQSYNVLATLPCSGVGESKTVVGVRADVTKVRIVFQSLLPLEPVQLPLRIRIIDHKR